MKDLAWGSGSGKAVKGQIPGYVFCVKIADKAEPLYRFVSYQDENAPEVISDTLACLAHAHAEEDTERILDDGTYMRAYEAWSLAKEDIYEKWEFLTHPKNVQPSVPKAMRDALEILRKTPPANMNESEINILINSLESDYGMRIQRRIREAIQSGTSD